MTWLDDDRARAVVRGLGSRRHCVICRDSAGRERAGRERADQALVEGGGIARDEGQTSGHAPGPIPRRRSGKPHLRGPRQAPILAPALAGWISASDGAGNDRHAVHAATKCVFARGDSWRQVTVEMTEGPVGVRAGWWHAPAVRCWVPGSAGGGSAASAGSGRSWQPRSRPRRPQGLTGAEPGAQLPRRRRLSGRTAARTARSPRSPGSAGPRVNRSRQRGLMPGRG